MKRLVILAVGVIGVAGLGAAAWGLGAMATRRAATGWLDARTAEGWVARAGNLRVGGFPVAFRTRFTDLELVDPDTGIVWIAPVFTLDQQIFRLDRVDAIWPSEQTLGATGDRLTVTSSAMTAALDVQPAADFALDAMQARLADVAITSTPGAGVTLGAAWLDVVRRDGEDAAYDVGFEAAALIPPDVWRLRIDPGSLLPYAVDSAMADATIGFDAPWDMAAIEDARPQITRIDLRELSAQWGELLFAASGALAVTPAGLPEGDLEIRAENWRAMLDLAENAGLLPAALRPTTETMLAVLAGMSGREEDIDATLTFSDGRVFIGPFPIGPAPNLRLR